MRRTPEHRATVAGTVGASYVFAWPAALGALALACAEHGSRGVRQARRGTT
jgi:hypothetical protein